MCARPSNATSRPKKVTAPTLILYGSADSQPFTDASRWMHQTIKGGQLQEVPLAGHASVRERPEFVPPRLHEFLD
jgi:3-oxoadipate enol-lactonase